MALSPRLSRVSAAALALLGLVGALACGGKKNTTTPPSTSFAITGTVFYTKVPIHKDANGVPTGLETDPTKFVTRSLARGLVVKLFQRNLVTLPDGGTTVTWSVAAATPANNLGTYRFFAVPGIDYCVQVESTMAIGDTGVNILADPNGLASTLPVSERLRYILRSAPDGTLATPTNPMPYSRVSDNLTVQFTVDVDTPWMIGRVDADPLTHVAPLFDQAGFETAGTTGSGSRVLSILDTAYEVAAGLGSPTLGGILDLHYKQGLSDPGGTFIAYDRSRWLQPDGSDLAYDANSNAQHWFGTVQGGANDDSRDVAVIYEMLARAAYFSQIGSSAFAGAGAQRLRPTAIPLDNLSPDMALIEAFSLAVTANYLQSPYLADTNGGSLVRIKDVRDLSAVPAASMGPFSARTITAAAWDYTLKINGLPNPGTSTDWDKINPGLAARFFTPTLSQDQIDLYNVFAQIQAIKGSKTSDGVTLDDATLTALLQRFNIPWPRPTTAPDSGFVTYLGADATKPANPNGTYGPYTLSMAGATQVNGVYPGLSFGELSYAYFTLDTDTTYNINVTTSPATLPSGAQLEFCLLTPSPNRRTILLSGSTTQPIQATFTGLPLPNPQRQGIRLRILSPTTQIPDVQVSLTFTKALVPKHS